MSMSHKIFKTAKNAMFTSSGMQCSNEPLIRHRSYPGFFLFDFLEEGPDYLSSTSTDTNYLKWETE